MNTQDSGLSDWQGLRNKWLRRLLILIIAFSVVLIALSTAIQYGATDEHFYDTTFEKLDSREKLGLNETNFEAVKMQLIRYVGLKTERFSVMVTLKDQEVDFFNDKERSHMIDVRKLFVLNRKIQQGAIALVLALYLIGKYGFKQSRLVIDGLILSGPLMLLVVGILGFMATQDFTAVFIKFHELFFSNELWLLDPATDRMIVLLEESFFSAMALRIGVYTLLISGFGTAMGIVLRRNLPRK